MRTFQKGCIYFAIFDTTFFRAIHRILSFTKGLSVDKIDLDILTGRGYLDNLELDEQFMSSVMELPQWMCLTKILCSKIKLKVCLFLYV